MAVALSSPRILYTECPLCESTRLQDVVRADCSKHPVYHPAIPKTMLWRGCLDCNHVFTDGYFTPEALQLIFGKTVSVQQVGYDIEKQRMVSARMIEKVLPYRQDGNWLDVGFGNGSLLFTAAEYGFTPVGIDLRQDSVAAIRNAGVEAYGHDMLQLEQPGRYQVISMADVLEHMPFPAAALRKAHELLASDGVLFLSMPNIDSIVWSALSQSNANPYWGELEHYHNFGRKVLYALLRKTGFEPLRFGISERYRVCMEIVAGKR